MFTRTLAAQAYLVFHFLGALSEGLQFFFGELGEQRDVLERTKGVLLEPLQNGRQHAGIDCPQYHPAPIVPRTPCRQNQGWAGLGFEVTEGIPRKSKKSDGTRGSRRRRNFSEFSGISGILCCCFFGISEEFVKTSEDFRNSTEESSAQI